MGTATIILSFVWSSFLSIMLSRRVGVDRLGEDYMRISVDKRFASSKKKTCHELGSSGMSMRG